MTTTPTPEPSPSPRPTGRAKLILLSLSAAGAVAASLLFLVFVPWDNNTFLVIKPAFTIVLGCWLALCAVISDSVGEKVLGSWLKGFAIVAAAAFGLRQLGREEQRPALEISGSGTVIAALRRDKTWWQGLPISDPHYVYTGSLQAFEVLAPTDLGDPRRPIQVSVMATRLQASEVVDPLFVDRMFIEVFLGRDDVWCFSGPGAGGTRPLVTVAEMTTWLASTSAKWPSGEAVDWLLPRGCQNTGTCTVVAKSLGLTAFQASGSPEQAEPMIDKIPLAIARRVNGLGFASRKFSAGLRNACDFTASHGLWAYVDISGRSGVDEWSPLAVRMIEKVSPDENQANMLAPDPQKGWFASALNRTGPYKRIKFRGAAVLRLDDENNAEVRAALAGIDKDFSQWISR